MVDDEIAASSRQPLERLLRLIDSTPPDEDIDIFGGEPTIDPNFWPVLRRALSTTRAVSLATNARLFHHLPSARLLAELSRGKLVVRTSLMGDTADLHDRLNVANNAFYQTVKGIKNLVDLGFAVHVNIVILKENIDHLLATAMVAIKAGVRNIKFSGLIRTHKFRRSLPNPADIRDRLTSIVPLLQRLNVVVKLEKLPLCVAGPYFDLVQTEALPTGVSNPWFQRTGTCRKCIFQSVCDGGERGAMEIFGDQWMQPLESLQGDLSEVDWRLLEGYEPEVGQRFVKVTSAPGDGADIAKVIGALHSFCQRYPHIRVLQ